MKKFRQEMAELIHDIIKCFLQTKSRQRMEIAHTMPIYKNGNKEEPINYRPV